jgi:SAM-dependent methyltransferase
MIWCGDMKKKKLSQIEKMEIIKLDFGCGNSPKEGFTGVDIIKFDKVDHVIDLKKLPWIWENNSVLEARTSHFIEHLSAQDRVNFVNELWRILIPGGRCEIVTPHWASCRAYGDPTHVWPPVSEFWFYYLSREWRETQAPHTDIKYNPQGFICNFEASWGYSLRQELMLKNQEYQMFAMANYKEVCQDTIATLIKKA